MNCIEGEWGILYFPNYSYEKILLPLLALSILAFAYTEIDVSNANYLATRGIITQQSTTAGFRLNDTITRAEAVGIALKIK